MIMLHSKDGNIVSGTHILSSNEFLVNMILEEVGSD
jgi:hypothetical protein